ncbi:MAG: amidohydrolase [Chloroflexi bacterium]|nr:amidohydrolase [Chloroflexota bacterium]
MRKKYKVIDTDIHHCLRDWSELQPYLDEPWRTTVINPGSRTGGNGLVAWGGHRRRDSVPPDGGIPGSNPAFLIKQLFDETGVDIGILTGDIYALSVHPNLDYANNVIRAYNDWTIDKWLKPYPQLRGSIAVNSSDPEAAAAEIHRLGARPDMVMVMMCATSLFPYGQRRYDPIYRAAVEHNLPVGLHLGAAGTGIAHAVSAVGYPTTFFEYHSGLPRIYMAQIISLVTEGTFEKFPTLKYIFIEGGISWLPHVMWRLDKNWKALRNDTPWVKRLPSEYIIDHCLFTTQPIEEPPNPEHLLQIFEMVHAEKTVMYSSDYPHWDFDPLGPLTHLPEKLKRRIFFETASELFNFKEESDG